MTKSALFLCLLLFTGVTGTMDAQTFKVGDYVETNAVGDQKTWAPCKVAGPLTYNQYALDCGAARTYVRPSQIRPRAQNVEDRRVEAETAAALAAQPKGSSLGARFGTREPRMCADRKAPVRGAPSADQVKRYLICDEEQENFRALVLLTNVKVQVAPVSKPMDPQVTHVADIDPKQPVWDIRGSYTKYTCAELSSMLGAPNIPDFARTHNCDVVEQPNSTGSCWKNTFGDWHCLMSDSRNVLTNIKHHVLPPAGN